MKRLSALLHPYSIGALAAVLLSLLIINHYPVVNSDGLVYLFLAQHYPQLSGFEAAMHTYDWPFFAIGLSWLAQALHISVLNAAYLTNVIFFSATVVIFIHIIKQLGANKCIQWLSLLIILFYHPFNHYNYEVLRDHGYWCLMLLSVAFMLKQVQKSRWYWGVLWAVTAVAGTLFRIEGGVFVLLLPWAVLLLRTSWWHKLKSWLQLYWLIMLLAGIFVLIYYLCPQHFAQSQGKGDKLLQQLVFGWQKLLNAFHHYSAKMSQHVMPAMFADDAGPILAFGIIGFYCYQLVFEVLGLSYALACIYAFCKRVALGCYNQQLVLVAYILLNIVITLVFAFQRLHFVPRYSQFLGLCLLIYVPYAIEHLYRTIRTSHTKRWGSRLLLVVILLGWMKMTVGSLIPFGPTKVYIEQAAQWVEQHASPKDKILTNIAPLNFILSDYSQVKGWQCARSTIARTLSDQPCFKWSSLDKKSWSHAKWAVIKVENQARVKDLKKVMPNQPVAVMTNHDGDKRVMIFRLSHSTS